MTASLTLAKETSADLRTRALLFTLAVIGALVLLVATSWGSGVSPDSALYIGAARRLLVGEGLTVPFGADAGMPLAHHAPLYPVVLALTGLLGSDPLYTARWLNAALFGGNILLIGSFVNALVQGRSRVLPLLGAFLAIVSVPLLSIHVMAWSEPLFLVLSLSGLWLLHRYLVRGRRGVLLLLALILSLALLTRYAGFAVIGASVLGVLLLGDGRSRRRRGSDALLLGVISVLPMLLWMGRNYVSAGTTTNRVIAWHPIDASHAWSALYTVSSWFLIPPGASDIVRIGLIVSLAAIFLAVIIVRVQTVKGEGVSRRYSGALFPDMAWLLFFFAATYVVFVVFSISLVDANIPLDNRILSPVYVAALPLLCYFSYELSGYARGSFLAKLLWLPIVLIVLATIGAAGNHVAEARLHGVGLTGSIWQRSETLACVRLLPANIVIHTNSPSAIYLHAGQATVFLPRKVDATMGQANDAYTQELDDVGSKLAQHESAVVYFTDLAQPTFPTMNELETQFSEIDTIELEDGVIFFAGQDQSGDSPATDCRSERQE